MRAFDPKQNLHTIPRTKLYPPKQTLNFPIERGNHKAKADFTRIPHESSGPSSRSNKKYPTRATSSLVLVRLGYSALIAIARRVICSQGVLAYMDVKKEVVEI
jgi:hypothetical protein